MIQLRVHETTFNEETIVGSFLNVQEAERCLDAGLVKGKLIGYEPMILQGTINKILYPTFVNESGYRCAVTFARFLDTELFDDKIIYHYHPSVIRMVDLRVDL